MASENKRSLNRATEKRPVAPAPECTPDEQKAHAAMTHKAPESADEARDIFTLWDQQAHAMIARLTAGVSPASISQAYGDWWTHLLLSPGKQAELAAQAQHQWNRMLAFWPQSLYGPACEPCVKPPAADDRFEESEWQHWPFNLIHQGFLLHQQWWDDAMRDVPGVEQHHEEVARFVTRQLLDLFSPANTPFTNPRVIERTQQSGGLNLINGVANAWEDIARFISYRPPAGADKYLPGESVAVTDGQVVYRNQLMELIQYCPATDTVQAEPLLIVPAWIMKYYILDLSPENSLVRWLVAQGHTVFMISWKNPGWEERDMGMADYRELGIMEALKAVNTIVPDRQVHAVGYCLGGTLLCMAAALMARRNDDRLASLTLLASLTDFAKAGELELFIDDSQVHFLEDVMRQQGYLEAWQMKSAFQLLQSNDLIWSRLVSDYLMGERMPTFDMMAWSTDGTRMPYRMHAQYLRKLYLDNELARGHYLVNGHPLNLDSIQLPAFVVATRKDHISPWRSVFRNQLYLGGDITFVLTSGGHNAGVVSEPGHAGRVYQIADKPADAQTPGADHWYDQVEEREGSWWLEWREWLDQHSSGKVAPPTLGSVEKGYAPLTAAPGQYVLER